MKLFLMRHAAAAEMNPAVFLRDSERPLTAAGLKACKAVARGMLAMGLKFDLLLSSPFLRARQTAEIVAQNLKLEKKIEYSANLATSGSPKALITELQAKQASANRILLVGHEPYLGQFAAQLLTGASAMTIVFKKAGLLKLEVDALKYDRCASLQWFLTPRQLERMGG